MDRLPLLLSASLLTACAGGAGGLFSGGDQDRSGDQAGPGAATTDVQGTRNVTQNLEIMGALAEGDSARQTEVFRDVAQEAELAPTNANRLKLALALATPGHPSSEPTEAQRLLTELLAADDALLPQERILATIHLKELELRLSLDVDALRLQQEASNELAQQNTESATLLQAAESENQRLRAELEDAQQKLDAIANIEQSIRARDDDTETP
jgi:hypothetical protein